MVLIEGDSRLAAADADFADLRDSVDIVGLNRGVLVLLDVLLNLGGKFEPLARVVKELDLIESNRGSAAERARTGKDPKGT